MNDKLEAVYQEHNGQIGRKKLSELTGENDFAVRSFLKGKRPVNVVSLNDWHIPYHDDKAVGLAIKFCEFLQPQYIVVHEVHDFYDLSRFDKNPKRQGQLQDELDLAVEYLTKLRKACPGSNIMLLESNHLDRLRRYLWSKARALDCLRCLDLKPLLNISDLNISLRDNFLFRDVLFKHGDIVRKHSAYTAKGELEREGCAGATGHTHRLGKHYTTKRGGSYVWMECGCLCSLDAEYIDGVADWQQGIGLVSFEPKGSQYIMSDIPIINGKLMFGNNFFVAWGGNNEAWER